MSFSISDNARFVRESTAIIGDDTLSNNESFERVAYLRERLSESERVYAMLLTDHYGYAQHRAWEDADLAAESGFTDNGRCDPIAGIDCDYGLEPVDRYDGERNARESYVCRVHN